jgi:GntR family transcriptional regulator
MEKIKKIRPQDMAMEQIQWYIQENQLKPHTQLPSERELCTMWQMNRSTLHTAIQQLIEERKLYSVKGSGTFVAPPRLVRDIKGIQSTSEAMRKTGYFLWTEVLISRIETCDGYVARKLQIKEGDIVFHLYRLRIRMFL